MYRNRRFKTLRSLLWNSISGRCFNDRSRVLSGRPVTLVERPVLAEPGPMTTDPAIARAGERAETGSDLFSIAASATSRCTFVLSNAPCFGRWYACHLNPPTRRELAIERLQATCRRTGIPLLQVRQYLSACLRACQLRARSGRQATAAFRSPKRVRVLLCFASYVRTDPRFFRPRSRNQLRTPRRW